MWGRKAGKASVIWGTLGPLGLLVGEDKSAETPRADRVRRLGLLLAV